MVNLSRMQMLIGIERRLKDRYRRSFEGATKITTQITGMPRSSGNHSQVEKGAVEMAEISDAYKEMFTDLEAMRSELNELLPSLKDPDDIAIMRLRYLSGRRPEEIWQELFMARRTMFYHLNKAERLLVLAHPDKVMR